MTSYHTALATGVYGTSRQLIKNNTVQSIQGGSSIDINVVTDAAYPSGTNAYSTGLSPNVTCTSLAATTSLTLGGASVLTASSLASYQPTITVSSALSLSASNALSVDLSTINTGALSINCPNLSTGFTMYSQREKHLIFLNKVLCKCLLQMEMYMLVLVMVAIS